MNDGQMNCSIHEGCERRVPVWLVLLDNLPTVILFLLGAVLVGFVSGIGAVILTLYNLASIVMFWGLICPHCHHFNTRACPCGYGVVAAGFFKKKEGSSFGKIFRNNIAIMYPCWFIPLGAGIYLLYDRYSRGILLVFVAFVFVGFILIPAISRLIGCRGCTIKDQCPWMTSGLQQDAGPATTLR